MLIAEGRESGAGRRTIRAFFRALLDSQESDIPSLFLFAMLNRTVEEIHWTIERSTLNPEARNLRHPSHLSRRPRSLASSPFEG